MASPKTNYSAITNERWEVAARDKLAQAESLRQAGSIDKCLSICSALLGKHPKYVGALHTAGLAYADKQDRNNALNYLVRAVMYCPDNWQAATALASAYLEVSATEMAAATLVHAATIAPDELSVIALRAMVFYEERDYISSAELFKQVLSKDPGFAGAAVGHALASVEMGRYSDAIASLKPLIQGGERSIRIIHLISRIPQQFHDFDLSKLAAEAKKTTSYKKGEFEKTLAFVNAGLVIKKGVLDEAWTALMAANKLAATGSENQRRLIAARQSEAITRLKSFRSRPQLAAHEPELPLSLFILGTSRSGKTTLESLIGNLPGICRGFENPIAFKAAQQVLRLSGFPDGGYANLPRELEVTCRDVYRKNLRKVAESAKVFTNTDPSLIHDALNIAAILPNVRFVFVKRNAYDTAFGILKTLYRFGNEYSYNLKSVWEHVKGYHEMIDLLSARFPEISYVMSYENIVEDPTGSIAKVADFCGIDDVSKTLGSLENDIGLGAPYSSIMDAALKS